MKIKNFVRHSEGMAAVLAMDLVEVLATAQEAPEDQDTSLVDLVVQDISLADLVTSREAPAVQVTFQEDPGTFPTMAAVLTICCHG
ncbi:hypothetical protein LJR153_005508 [Paenibacillus sp. LjRoot153]|uniref:hypothetical protein n=1 Tax=Paenibacillus sp. LjRoot153 TaxID=3342270 RepID=UPI003ECD5672